MKVNSATLESQGDGRSNVQHPTHELKAVGFNGFNGGAGCNVATNGRTPDGRAAKTFIYLSFSSFVQVFVGVFKVTRIGIG